MCRSLTFCLWALLLACQAQISGAPIDLAPVDTPDVDAAVTDALASMSWRTPAKVGPASTPAIEDDVTLSANTLEMFFAVTGANGKDLYYTSRASTAEPWTPATRLSFNSATQSDETPRLSIDDKTLYFASARGTSGTLDIYTTTRVVPGSIAWTEPQPLDPVNTTTLNEKWFMPCGTDHYVMIQNSAKGDSDLVEGSLSGPAPTPIAELNSTGNETGTFLSPDCLTIYFASTRANPSKIFRSQRAAISSAWQRPTEIKDFAIPGGNQEDPWISSDGRTFAFTSDATGTKDIYLSTR